MSANRSPAAFSPTSSSACPAGRKLLTPECALADLHRRHEGERQARSAPAGPASRPDAGVLLPRLPPRHQE